MSVRVQGSRGLSIHSTGEEAKWFRIGGQRRAHAVAVPLEREMSPDRYIGGEKTGERIVIISAFFSDSVSPRELCGMYLLPLRRVLNGLHYKEILLVGMDLIVVLKNGGSMKPRPRTHWQSKLRSCRMKMQDGYVCYSRQGLWDGPGSFGLRGVTASSNYVSEIPISFCPPYVMPSRAFST